MTSAVSNEVTNLTPRNRSTSSESTPSEPPSPARFQEKVELAVEDVAEPLGAPADVRPAGRKRRSSLTAALHNSLVHVAMQ